MMIQTQRTILRNLEKNDVDSMYDYRNDSRCSQYQQYEDTSREYLLRFVQTYAHCQFPSREEEQHYAIAALSNNQIIGDVSVFFTEKDHCFTLGLTIAPTHQRQGFGYEVLSEIVAQLQSVYPTVDIVALIEKENHSSIALFQKLGFVEECYAESIQSYVYCIYGTAGL